MPSHYSMNMVTREVHWTGQETGQWRAKRRAEEQERGMNSTTDGQQSRPFGQNGFA
ncbi:hypothetical protein [Paenibacillus sp. P3E]|uniref:hypothetical protein n=1 Tax=Paenibacillus sp. P3E TaxID=1349435 RepID=UPI0015BBFE67|nr:hypothetical protein [Paenibacillus sp. P3E]